MPLLPALEAQDGWTEAPTPELVKWEKPGEIIAGVLTGVDQIRVKGKLVTQYTLSLGAQRLKLLATYDLLQKLTGAHRGCQVRIKYLGEDESVRGGSSNTPMRRFSVQLKGTPTPQADSGPITDEDIPF